MLDGIILKAGRSFYTVQTSQGQFVWQVRGRLNRSPTFAAALGLCYTLGIAGIIVGASLGALGAARLVRMRTQRVEA